MSVDAFCSSPTHFAQNITCPVILFHGQEDYAVPPSQSEHMARVLNSNKIPNALVIHPGEGHGKNMIQEVMWDN